MIKMLVQPYYIPYAEHCSLEFSKKIEIYVHTTNEEITKNQTKKLVVFFEKKEYNLSYVPIEKALNKLFMDWERDPVNLFHKHPQKQFVDRKRNVFMDFENIANNTIFYVSKDEIRVCLIDKKTPITPKLYGLKEIKESFIKIWLKKLFNIPA